MNWRKEKKMGSCLHILFEIKSTIITGGYFDEVFYK